MPPRKRTIGKRGGLAPNAPPSTEAPIEHIGAKKPKPGSKGTSIKVKSNFFNVTIEELKFIYHYNVISKERSEKPLPARLNMALITRLEETQTNVHAAYDGRKSLYTTKELDFGGAESKEVATINPEVLRRFIVAKQSHDNDVITARNALNIVIRMGPLKKEYPSNGRSFFPNVLKEMKYIGSGIEIW
ncbi:hypothetical protein BDQ17DRAFT_1433844 [Cyathus striatus]|nr:hypothetical protein BDQ17DRAFT_1433844 [Cyathus striatus]